MARAAVPISATGGYDWHTVRGYLEAGFIEGSELAGETIAAREYRSRAHAHITASFYGPTSLRGEPLSYPPVHFHHGHLRAPRSEPGGTSDELFLQNHADSHCHSEHGGARCFVETFPEAYGIAVPPAVKVYS